MNMQEQFLSSKQRYRPISLSEEFTDEEMARDWTLSKEDAREIGGYRKKYRLYIAVQICVVRLYGRFLKEVNDLSPRILSYLNKQLNLPPSLKVQVPKRRATGIEFRQQVLKHLGFQRLTAQEQQTLQTWLETKAKQGALPHDLFHEAETYLLQKHILLPGPSVLEKLIIHVCSEVHEQLFATIYEKSPPALRKAIDELLTVPKGERLSKFSLLKSYPPEAKISSLKDYLQRYQTLVDTGIDAVAPQLANPALQNYLFKLTKKYKAKDVRRFHKRKRYALMICFLLETRKVLLDHLVKMHDQYIATITRQSKSTYEKEHRALRKRQKRAVDVVLHVNDLLLAWPKEEPILKQKLWQQVNELDLRTSLDDLRVFKRLEERGYGDILMRRYPSLRKYFADFIHLPFAAGHGSAPLLKSILLIRQLDANKIKKLPKDTPTAFVPKELQRALHDEGGKLNRNIWEMGLALALKDALRSGDLYLPQSKQYVSFWNMMLSDTDWQALDASSHIELELPQAQEAKDVLTTNFQEGVVTAREQFSQDTFAQISNGKLKLKRNDKLAEPDNLTKLQSTINASMPPIRIENLLMEVDQSTHFTRHFKPIQGHRSRPNLYYKTLLAGIISQATNLGVVAMSASVKDISLDMIRHALHSYVREETIQPANAELVNRHHQLPFSSIYGSGEISSSDAQRFGIRASSLLASYYPRYYGYYKKAIGIYTHVSDQYSVFSTKVISCSPREALYVLDGLLENNTILKPKKHTTDTHGYTEIIFALCYLLGYEFMPRIRDLKDQQLYRLSKDFDYGVFTPLLNKSANIDLVIEQWSAMLRVVLSLKQRTAPAHVVVERLINSYPADRLAKAFTHLGRIIKTQYILRYLTDPQLRLTVQRQLNKGEYRHKLPRWIFFANQGEFTKGDYEEIMNKASCLSLVSNAILYWNTIKINDIVTQLRQQGEKVEDETLSHISLLPFRHVLPNGTYFIES